MRLSVRLFTLKRLIEHINVPLIKIPTNKYEEIVNTHKTSSQILKENQRKLSDMSRMIHDVLMSLPEGKAKHFMDLKMVLPFQEVMKQYNNIKLSFGPNKIPPVNTIEKFLKEHFEEDKDIEAWQPPDWVAEPLVFKSIKDPGFRKLANHINGMWVKLGRRTNENIKKNKDRHNILYLKNGFIISSTGFEEMTYWDSYWIARGLLACEMFNTVKGILQNFIYLLDQYGYVPRSNRIYHQDQTQIPMLILLTDDYLKNTADHDFLKENIQILEKELLYWKNERALPVTIGNKVYNLYRYLSNGFGPRPENYKSDYMYLSSQIQVRAIMSGIRAAEESGWTSSSRWIDLLGENEGSMSDISTENIIPVDLNAILHKNMTIMAKWYSSIGDIKKTEYYNQMAEELQDSIHEVLWHGNLGMWCDYNFASSEPRRYHYLSNFTPLWTGSYKDKTKLPAALLHYISDHNLHTYPGGVPVSMEFSGDSWDFPNVQPGMLATFLEGLDSLEDAKASQTALLLAEMWLDSVYKGFVDRQLIYDQYKCLNKGEPIENNQKRLTGFGVTNGVVITMLAKWGSLLRSSNEDNL